MNREGKIPKRRICSGLREKETKQSFDLLQAEKRDLLVLNSLQMGP